LFISVAGPRSLVASESRRKAGKSRGPGCAHTDDATAKTTAEYRILRISNHLAKKSSKQHRANGLIDNLSACEIQHHIWREVSKVNDFSFLGMPLEASRIQIAHYRLIFDTNADAMCSNERKQRR
jgi:hypothetical protein